MVVKHYFILYGEEQFKSFLTTLEGQRSLNSVLCQVKSAWSNLNDGLVNLSNATTYINILCSKATPSIQPNPSPRCSYTKLTVYNQTPLYYNQLIVY